MYSNVEWVDDTDIKMNSLIPMHEDKTFFADSSYLSFHFNSYSDVLSLIHEIQTILKVDFRIVFSSQFLARVSS